MFLLCAWIFYNFLPIARPSFQIRFPHFTLLPKLYFARTKPPSHKTPVNNSIILYSLPGSFLVYSLVFNVVPKELGTTNTLESNLQASAFQQSPKASRQKGSWWGCLAFKPVSCQQGWAQTKFKCIWFQFSSNWTNLGFSRTISRHFWSFYKCFFWYKPFLMAHSSLKWPTKPH